MPPSDGKPPLAPAPAPSNSAASASGATSGIGGANVAGSAGPGRTQAASLLTAHPLPPAPAPRPRNQGGRKKMVPIEPDSLYRGNAVSAHGTPTHGPHTGVGASAKRGVDGGPGNEPRKRKRVEAQHASASGTQQHSRQSAANNIHAHSQGAFGRGSAGIGSAITGAGGSHHLQSSQGGNNITGASNGFGVGGGTGFGVDGDGQSCLIEFSTLPTSALYEYIIQYDLVPVIYPTPLTAEDPPLPAALLDPARMASRAPTPTPLVTPMMMNQLMFQHQEDGSATRPRRSREAKEVSRRRSTRLLEEELRGAGGGMGGGIGMEQVPVLADVSAVHGVLATIAARHFRESSVREMDTLTSFLGAVKARR